MGRLKNSVDWDLLETVAAEQAAVDSYEYWQLRLNLRRAKSGNIAAAFALIEMAAQQAAQGDLRQELQEWLSDVLVRMSKNPAEARRFVAPGQGKPPRHAVSLAVADQLDWVRWNVYRIVSAAMRERRGQKAGFFEAHQWLADNRHVNPETQLPFSRSKVEKLYREYRGDDDVVHVDQL